MPRPPRADDFVSGRGADEGLQQAREVQRGKVVLCSLDVPFGPCCVLVLGEQVYALNPRCLGDRAV